MERKEIEGRKGRFGAFSTETFAPGDVVVDEKPVIEIPIADPTSEEDEEYMKARWGSLDHITDDIPLSLVAVMRLASLVDEDGNHPAFFQNLQGFSGEPDVTVFEDEALKGLIPRVMAETSLPPSKLAQLYQVVLHNAVVVKTPVTRLLLILRVFKQISMIDHSCTPNCIMAHTLEGTKVVAMTNISPGDEITVAYMDKVCMAGRDPAVLGNFAAESCWCPQCKGVQLEKVEAWSASKEREQGWLLDVRGLLAVGAPNIKKLDVLENVALRSLSSKVRKAGMHPWPRLHIDVLAFQVSFGFLDTTDTILLEKQRRLRTFLQESIDLATEREAVPYGVIHRARVAVAMIPVFIAVRAYRKVLSSIGDGMAEGDQKRWADAYSTFRTAYGQGLEELAALWKCYPAEAEEMMWFAEPAFAEAIRFTTFVRERFRDKSMRGKK